MLTIVQLKWKINMLLKSGTLVRNTNKKEGRLKEMSGAFPALAKKIFYLSVQNSSSHRPLEQ